VVAGDDAATAWVVCQRTGDEELVGGQHQLLDDRIRSFGAGPGEQRALTLLGGGQ
jgi:hypothetical protein